MIISSPVGHLQCQNVPRRYPKGSFSAPSMAHVSLLHTQRRPMGMERKACRERPCKMCRRARGKLMEHGALWGLREDVRMMWDAPGSRVEGKRGGQWVASSVSTSGSHKDDNDASALPLESSKDAKNALGANVPWGAGKIVEVMALWLCALFSFRAFIWRAGMYILNVASEADISPIYQATLTFTLDVSMMAGTIFILKRSLASYRPLRSKGLFPFRMSGRWWIMVLLSCLWIPLVDLLGSKMMVWFPEPADGLQSSMEVQLGRGSMVPNALYFIILSVCAPVWEETIFRGFLLPSLGKYLPPSIAVFASSSIFAILHGSIRQFLPLFLLGVVIANAFIASNNLLPAILLHSLYNSYVFIHMLLAS